LDRAIAVMPTIDTTPTWRCFASITAICMVTAEALERFSVLRQSIRFGVAHGEPPITPNPAPTAGSEVLRRPGLRNVAIAPRYFHDGSAPTPEDAVRKTAVAQLESGLTDQQADDLVASPGARTGPCCWISVGAPP
jgi:hypothetical protein